MLSYVVRVWLPDRPGALGLVASRIGAVGGDVVGIEILERGGGMAVDDLTVQLPDPSLVDLLVGEVRQVDGAAVEHVHHVDAQRPEPGLLALRLAARTVALAPGDRPASLADAVSELVDADWVVVTDCGGTRVVTGSPPDLGWLDAFLEGSRHLADPAAELPGDVAWAAHGDRSLACGRGGRVFHTRERALIQALVDLVGSVRPAS